MYRILGADGREYGPVSADQLREWIAQGRANERSRVLPEGGTDWVTLGEVPDFASDLGLRKEGEQARQAPPMMTDRLAEEYLEHPGRLSISNCLSRGWNLVRGNFWLAVGATALVVVLVWAASFVPVLGSLLFNYVLLGGLDWMFLKLARGQKAELADAFVGFGPMFVPLMLFSLVGQLLTILGLVLCIIPGVYAMVVWLLFPTLLILDKGMDFWPAMELSRKVVHRHFWPVFGLALICALLMLAGVLAAVVGLFVAMPIATAAIVYAYEDLFRTDRGHTGIPAQAQPGEG